MLRQHLTLAIFVDATFGDRVATLNELTETLAYATGLQRATAFAYGRFAREAGLISQKGRGTNAALMTFRDAANLLLAVGGTSTTREAGETIKAFSALEGLSPGTLNEPFAEWLKPLGLKKITKFGQKLPLLEADFGTFLEFLMRDASTGRLNDVLRSLPVVEIDRQTVRRYLLKPNSTETLLADRRVVRKPPSEIAIGWEKDVWIDLEFNRTNPTVWIHFRRSGMQTETVCSFMFRPRKPIGQRDMAVTTSFTQTTVAALAYCVTNGPLPRHARNMSELESLLFLASHDE
jgi:hypothetical protein